MIDDQRENGQTFSIAKGYLQNQLGIARFFVIVMVLTPIGGWFLQKAVGIGLFPALVGTLLFAVAGIFQYRKVGNLKRQYLVLINGAIQIYGRTNIIGKWARRVSWNETRFALRPGRSCAGIRIGVDDEAAFPLILLDYSSLSKDCSGIVYPLHGEVFILTHADFLELNEILKK